METATLIYNVIFSSVAEHQLDDLFFYIAENGGGQHIAENFVGGIHQFCMKLANFPNRGTRRESADIPNLHTLPYKRRVVIAFTVDEATALVTILGVFYGGQDYERHLAIDASDD